MSSVELRRRGVAVITDPAVLDRQALAGVVSVADTVGAVLSMVFGGTFALVAFGVSFGYRYGRLRILRELAASANGRALGSGRD